MKIFLDSSILIEYEKQANSDLLEALVDSEHQLFISPIVVSEYLYQLLGIIGGRSPMSICESAKIKETLLNHDTEEFLSGFQILSIPGEAIPLGIDFMKKYNLLPNDALILATCKIQDVHVVASFDNDFVNACSEEGIRLISKVSDLV